ncbi:UNVERIFIED_CONTAM: hypothetical protein K2H54_038249 [Gekko kuhli]
MEQDILLCIRTPIYQPYKDNLPSKKFFTQPCSTSSEFQRLDSGVWSLKFLIGVLPAVIQVAGGDPSVASTKQTDAIVKDRGALQEKKLAA